MVSWERGSLRGSVLARRLEMPSECLRPGRTDINHQVGNRDG